MRRALAPRRLRAGATALAIVGAAALLIAGIVTGPTTTARQPRLVAGTAWFALLGELALADGPSARVISFASGTSAGTRSRVAQVGTSAVAFDPETRAVTVAFAAGGDWVGSPVPLDARPPEDSIVLAGERHAWVVSPSAAWAQQIDAADRPVTVGRPVGLPTGAGPEQLAVTGDGALWVVDATAGLVRRYDGGRLVSSTPVAVAGTGRLAVVGDRPVVVDDAAVSWLAGAGDAIERVDTTLSGRAAVARSSTAAAGLLAVEPDGRLARRSSPDAAATHESRRDATPAAGEYPVGAPVVAGDLVYVPLLIEGAAALAIVGMGPGGLDTAPPQVVQLGFSGPFSLFAHHGHVWFHHRPSSGDPLVGVVAGRGPARQIELLRTTDAAQPIGMPTGSRTGHWPVPGSEDATPPDSPPGRSTPVCPRNAADARCRPGPGDPSASGGRAPDGAPHTCPANAPDWGCAAVAGGSRGGGPGAPPAPGAATGPLGAGAPAVDIRWDPPAPRVGQQVTFTAWHGDRPAAPDAVRWQFDRGTPAVSDAAHPTVTWLQPDAYRVTATVATSSGPVVAHDSVVVAGPGEVQVPKLVRVPHHEAQARLRAAGLEVGRTTYRPSVQRYNTVIAATRNGDALADRELVPAGSTIDLEVSSYEGPIAIAAGLYHFCTLVADGTARCWGTNANGQLGDGADGNTPDNRVVTPAVTDVRSLAAGDRHTCAAHDDGSLSCWGANNVGQLGDGTAHASRVPIAVPGVRDVEAISAGHDHTCAIRSEGRIWCWGRNDDGQLGPDPGRETQASRPVEVPGPVGAEALDAGRAHTCAIVAGTVWCWGENEAGQLGDGTKRSSARPVQVAGIDDAVEVSAMDSHTCARLRRGEVWCWGVNFYGELGRGYASGFYEPSEPLPGRVRNLNDPLALNIGHGDSPCAVLADEAVSCWGVDYVSAFGQRERVTAPATVAHAVSVHAIATSLQATCVLRSGVVECWGLNSAGELGPAVPVNEPSAELRGVPLG
jgi:alpha-tubulin suppressor-like RCC1 family protein